MAIIEKRDLTRVNMNLPSLIVQKVKEYAYEMGLPLTQAYVFLINLGLQQKDITTMMPKFLEGINDLKSLSEKINDK